MNVQQAKQHILNSGISARLQQRACALLDDPNKLDQNVFGICGAISIIYLLLRLAPGLFAQLAVSAAKDQATFQKARSAYHTQQQNQAQPDLNALLDFLVAHYLIARLDGNATYSGHIFHCQEDKFKDSLTTKKQQGTDIIQEQRQFSGTFNIKKWDQLGHFALRMEALVYLMNNIIKAKLALGMLTDKVFMRSWVRVQAAQADAKTAYILAGIREPSAWVGNQPVDAAHVPKGTDPEFAHWVVINSIQPASDDSDYYVVKFWTWTSEYQQKFKKSVMSGYLACLVYGFLED